MPGQHTFTPLNRVAVQQEHGLNQAAVRTWNFSAACGSLGFLSGCTCLACSEGEACARRRVALRGCASPLALSLPSLSPSLSPAPVGSGGSKPGAGGRRSGQRRVRPRGARAAVAGSWGRSPFPCAFLAAEPRRAGGARGRRRRGAAASCRAGLLREDRAS